VSAIPAPTIDNFDAVEHRTGVAELNLMSSGSRRGELVVAALYGAAVIPAMAGWVYVLARCCSAIVIWVVS
jgi:hypothetical protein